MRAQRADRLMLWFAISTLAASTAMPLGGSAVASGGVQKPRRSQPRSSQPRLVELRSIDQLKEVFQRDRSKVRLVALVSPT